MPNLLFPAAKLVYFEPAPTPGKCQRFISRGESEAKLTGSEPAKHTEYAKHAFFACRSICLLDAAYVLCMPHPASATEKLDGVIARRALSDEAISRSDI